MGRCGSGELWTPCACGNGGAASGGSPSSPPLLTRFKQFDYLPASLYEATVRAANALPQIDCALSHALYFTQIRYLRDTLVADQRAHPKKRHAFLATYPAHYQSSVESNNGAKPTEREWGGTGDHLWCNNSWKAPQQCVTLVLM